MNTVATRRQRPGHWAEQDTPPTVYEEPIALPVTAKEKRIHATVWVTALTLSPLLVVAVVSAIGYYFTH